EQQNEPGNSRCCLSQPQSGEVHRSRRSACGGGGARSQLGGGPDDDGASGGEPPGAGGPPSAGGASAGGGGAAGGGAPGPVPTAARTTESRRVSIQPNDCQAWRLTLPPKRPAAPLAE